MSAAAQLHSSSAVPAADRRAGGRARRVPRDRAQRRRSKPRDRACRKNPRAPCAPVDAPAGKSLLLGTMDGAPASSAAPACVALWSPAPRADGAALEHADRPGAALSMGRPRSPTPLRADLAASGRAAPFFGRAPRISGREKVAATSASGRSQLRRSAGATRSPRRWF